MKNRTLSIKLGKRLKAVREKKKFTQEELALEAGLNRAYIGYIERGERNPTIFTMSRLARALGVKLFVLFQFE